MYRLRVIWGQSVTVRPQLHRAVRPWQLCVSREKCVFSDFLLEVSESHWVKLQRGIWCCPLAISLVPSKLPDSLQTHKSYWPSGGETMKSGARTRNRLLAFKVKAVPLKYVESCGKACLLLWRQMFSISDLHCIFFLVSPQPGRKKVFVCRQLGIFHANDSNDSNQKERNLCVALSFLF